MMDNICYRKFITILLLLSCFSFDTILYAHGFAQGTLVKSGNSSGWSIIEQTAHLSRNRKKQYVASYDEHNDIWTKKRVTGGAFARTNCCCKLSFDDQECNDIICSPTQLFYSSDAGAWVPAYKLAIGDLLLCAQDEQIRLSNLTLVETPCVLYTIQVEDTHTFCVGVYNIVAHNMLILVFGNHWPKHSVRC